MRFGALIPCLNEWRFLPAVVGQLLKATDRCAIIRSRRSFSGASAALDPLPPFDPRVEVLEGEWANAHATRNAGLDALSDCDYVFTIDSDEILLDGDLDQLRALCGRNQYHAIGSRLYTYWKTPEYRIDPPEVLVALMAVRPSVRFVNDRRIVDGEMVYARNVWCQHLSYVRTDDEMRDKLRLFPHAHEVVPGWFERVWRAWDENKRMTNLHPTHPANYYRAVYDPNPELMRVLAKFGCGDAVVQANSA